MKSQRVNIGAPGATPKKELMFSQADPATSVSWMAFAQSSGESEHVGNPERPKTSRHKQNPTPDEFADYVVASPEFKRERDASEVLSFNGQVSPEVLFDYLIISYHLAI